MTDKQKDIINFCKDFAEVKKSKIVDKFEDWYHWNADFHIGNLLSTMVKQGLLLRVKKGVYKVSTEDVKVVKKGNIVIDENPNQLTLF